MTVLGGLLFMGFMLMTGGWLLRTLFGWMLRPRPWFGGWGWFGRPMMGGGMWGGGYGMNRGAWGRPPQGPMGGPGMNQAGGPGRGGPHRA